jgi:hypothetical protein
MSDVDGDYFSPAPTPLPSADGPEATQPTVSGATITIPTFSLTRRELAQALRSVQIGSTRSRLVLVGSVIVYIAVGVVTHTLIVWVAVSLLVITYLLFGTAALAWRRNNGALSNLAFEFSRDGMTCRTPTVSIEKSWDHFDRLATLRRSYLLFSGRAWRVLPRRVFASPAAEQQFVEMVRSNIRRRDS